MSTHTTPRRLRRISVRPSDSDPTDTYLAPAGDPYPEDPESPRAPLSNLQAKHHRLAELIAEHGIENAKTLMAQAGFGRSASPTRVLRMIAELIEEKRNLFARTRPMRLAEAEMKLAERARDDSDPKTQLVAIRTVLEVEGVLGRSSTSQNNSDRGSVTREIEQLVGALRKAGLATRVRAAIEITADEKTNQLADESVAHTPASASQIIDVEPEK